MMRGKFARAAGALFLALALLPNVAAAAAYGPGYNPSQQAGSGGGGDASAANQQTQISNQTSELSKLDDVKAGQASQLQQLQSVNTNLQQITTNQQTQTQENHATTNAVSALNNNLGFTTDAKATDWTGAATLIALTKQLGAQAQAFYASQSAATAGGATAAKQDTGNGSLASLATSLGAPGDAAAADAASTASAIAILKAILAKTGASSGSSGSSAPDYTSVLNQIAANTLAASGAVGTQSDTAATNYTANASVIALLKRTGADQATAALQTAGNGTLTSINTNIQNTTNNTATIATNTQATASGIGTTADNAPASPSAAASVIGLLKYIAANQATGGNQSSNTATFNTIATNTANTNTNAAAISAVLGAKSDAPATDWTSAVTMMALMRYMGQTQATAALQSSGNASLSGINTAIGTTADAPASSATATASVISILRYIAQNQATNSGQSGNTSTLSTIATNTANTDTDVKSISTAQGTTADSAATNSTGTWTVVALLKGLWAQFTSLIATVGTSNGYLATIASAISNALSVNTQPLVYVAATVTPSASAHSGTAAAPVVIGTNMTFTGLTTANQSGALMQNLQVIFPALPGAAPTLRLLLFASAVAAVTDGSALSLSATDAANVRGSVPITSCYYLGTPYVCEAKNLAQAVKSASNGGAVYGILVAENTVSPATTGAITVGINALPDR